MTTFYSRFPPPGGGGGSGITSINGNSNAAQIIAAGSGVSVSSVGGTTTISSSGAASAITALTGDVTATGPGSVAASLVATTNATLTTLSGLTTAASLATVGTITSGTWSATTIAIAKGGTGQTTANAAFNALSPLTTKGDLISFSTVNARLAVGSNGQVLTADSAQTLGVKWATPTTGTVTSIDVSGGTTGLTFSGGPITSSGTITMGGGPLAVTFGGTGTATQFTQGSMIFAGASGVYAQNNSNLFWDNTNLRYGVGTASPTATIHIAQPVATTGSPTAGLIVGGAHTTLTASTEAKDIFFNLARTVQFATGAITNQRAVYVAAATYGFVGASTITTGATLAVSGPPVAGTNATITNKYSFLSEGGTVGVRFAGGTAGSQELQLSHDGTGGFITSQTVQVTLQTSGGNSSIVTFLARDGKLTLQDGGVGLTLYPASSRRYIWDNGAGRYGSGQQFGWSSNADPGGAVNDTQLFRNAASVIEINNGTSGQWGALKCGVRDAGTTTVTNGVTIGHQSSGTPAAGLGSAILFNINSTTTADRNAAQISAFWTTATDASRTSAITFSVVNSAAALAEAVRISGAGSMIIGTAAIATNATDGFLYLPSCAGTPTGTPTTFTGTVATVYDTTNNKLYIYNGSWRSILFV